MHMCYPNLSDGLLTITRALVAPTHYEQVDAQLLGMLTLPEHLYCQYKHSLHVGVFPCRPAGGARPLGEPGLPAAGGADGAEAQRRHREGAGRLPRPLRQVRLRQNAAQKGTASLVVVRLVQARLRGFCVRHIRSL